MVRVFVVQPDYIGIRQSPHQITLSDEDGDDVRVKLYSEDEIGKHLLLTLKE